MSYLAVPIVSRSGEALGGLFFGHQHAGMFTERHEQIVQGLAAHVAVAMDNARLYDHAQREIAERALAEEELVRLTRRLRLLLQVSTETGQHLQLDAPFDGAMRALVDALPDTDTAAIFVHDPATDLLVPQATCRTESGLRPHSVASGRGHLRCNVQGRAKPLAAAGAEDALHLRAR